MKTISVHTGVPYDIHIGAGLLSDTSQYISQVVDSRHTVIVTDDTVNRLYGKQLCRHLKDNGFQVELFQFTHGELSKSMETLASLFNFLAKCQITRDDFLIALGGGVVGDLTGFAAACYLRGIDFIQIPTTLLAQIDSSVGGKTAVDIPEGKNLVGAFHQPRLVICDINTLDTLPKETFCDGMAEVIKYGAIRSASLFQKLEDGKSGTELEEIICECIDIKRRIVENDEFDRGERMLLNFGHTLGHAIEKIYHYDTYSHGQGVAIGMVRITKLSEKYGLTKPGTADRIRSLCKKYGLPTQIKQPPTELVKNSLNDKKRSSGRMNIVLVKSIGESMTYPLSIQDYQKFVLGEYQCR